MRQRYNNLMPIMSDVAHRESSRVKLSPEWLAPIAIVAITIFAFLPVFQNGFVNWDDDLLLTNNPNYRGFSWENIRWMFSTVHMGHFQPLSWLTYALDYQIWKMDPFGYHLTNLLLHLANSVVFYFLARGLFRYTLPESAVFAGRVSVAAFFATLLFSVHPLRVESVAWATERRDVLSSLFYLLAVLAYLRTHADHAKIRTRPFIAMVAMSVALLAKCTAVTLLAVFLILDIYLLRRVPSHPRRWLDQDVRPVWREKIPFAVLSVLFSAVAFVAQVNSQSLHPLSRHGIAGRLVQSMYGAAWYIWKTICPLRLSCLYELPQYNTLEIDYRFVVFGGALFVASMGLLISGRWKPVMAAILCYWVTISPVLGMFQNGPQIAADRYSYLSCMSLVLMAAGIALYGVRTRLARWGMTACACVAVAMLVILTWRQAQVWRTSETLWWNVVRSSSDSSGLARLYLVRCCEEEGRYAEALDHYTAFLRMYPDETDARGNYGIALMRSGRYAEAAAQLEAAMRHLPDEVRILNALAVAYAHMGQADEAVELLRRAMQLKPDFVEAYIVLGNIRREQGKWDEAASAYRQSLVLQPQSAVAERLLATALIGRRDWEPAMHHARRAISLSLEPSVAAYECLAEAKAGAGRYGEAIEEVRRAMKIAEDRHQHDVVVRLRHELERYSLSQTSRPAPSPR